MKIESGRRVAASATTRKAGAAAPAPAFAPTAEGVAQSSAVASVGFVTPLDALIALQSEDRNGAHRAGQMRRGRRALEALERLERGLLAGRAPAALRDQLASALEAAAPTGEAGLDELLREIDTRLAVELAKLDAMLGSS